MNIIVEELSRRWRTMFSQLQRGDDLPPGTRLRAEGMMEAASLSGMATAAELQALMAVHYEEVMGTPLDKEFGPDWCEFFPFPQIPAVARRAPVFPSTGDENATGK